MSKKETRGAGFGIRLFVLILVFLVIISVFLFSGVLRNTSVQRLAYYLTSGISGNAESTNISFPANENNRFHLLKKHFLQLALLK